MGKRANGEGSISKRSDGRWTARVTLPDGRRKCLYGKTRAEVAGKMAAAIKARDDGLPSPSEQTTVKSFLVGWLDTYRSAVRPSTWRRYNQLATDHAIPMLGRLRLTGLGQEHLRRLYSVKLDEGLAPATVRQLHAVLRRALADAERWGLAARNVASLVRPPRVGKADIRPLTAEQAMRFLESARGDEMEALYVLALTTGMRQGELLGLRWEDVGLDAADLRVRRSLQRTNAGLVFEEPKTDHSRRRINLAALAVAALRAHRARQAEQRLALGPAWDDLDLVFSNAVGRPIEAGNLVRRSFKPLLARAGLPPIRFHDLRHTAATLLLGQGVHAKIVSEMLGHASIAITLDTYSHVLPTMQASAASAMDAVLGGR